MYVTGFGKTLRNDFFLKIEPDVWLISSTIELTHISSFRPIMHFVVKIQPFVCDCALHPIIEKLRTKGVAMYTYGVFLILRVNQKSIKWPWAGPFQMKVKIEQGLNFVVQNDSRVFFDAQEA